MHRERRRYDRQETADILDLASALEVSSLPDADLGRSDLYRIAEELGISDVAVDQAIRSLAHGDRVRQREAKKAIRRRMRFYRHALAYTVVVAILALVDLLGGGGWWFFYVAGIWGIALALHAMRFVTRRNGPLERRVTARVS